MAASITRNLPKTINRSFSKRLSYLTRACCCNNSRTLSHFVIQEPSALRKYCRYFSTSLQLWQHDMIQPEPGANEAVIEQDPDEDELDVLYRKIVVEVKAHDRQVLRSYEEFVKLTCQCLKIKIAKITKPKYDVLRQSVNKSPHIYKKHYSQYEQRTHFLVVEIPKLTGSTADTFLEYIQRNLPEGVAMKVTRHRVEKLPDHLKPPTKTEETQLDT